LSKLLIIGYKILNVRIIIHGSIHSGISHSELLQEQLLHQGSQEKLTEVVELSLIVCIEGQAMYEVLIHPTTKKRLSFWDSLFRV